MASTHACAEWRRRARAQERLERQPDGLLRITLKRAESDGTLAVDMDPISLLCRLAMSVPPPCFHIRDTGRAFGLILGR